jgi:hypothetical protein
MNQEQTIKALKEKLSTDTRWARRALVRIFAEQTNDEQTGATVRYHNTVGFKCTQSVILTSLANQLERRKSLSPKQDSLLCKMMPTYARQLIRLTGKDKIVQALQGA